MLSHVSSSTAGRKKREFVVNDVFKVTFEPPTGVQSDNLIISEHIRSVSGLVERAPDVIEQEFMQAKMLRASNAAMSTDQDFTIELTRNLDELFVDYVKEFWDEWRALVGDPNTGMGSLAVDYMGTVIIEMALRSRDVWAKYTLLNAFPYGELAGPLDLDYSNPEAIGLSITMRAEDMKKETRRLSSLGSLEVT